MAGVHQHHVWQMMQRGFGTKKGKYHHIWVYEKGQEPRQTSTRKYGVKANFLTTGFDRTADDVLTQFESDTQDLIHDLRVMAHGSLVPSEAMAPFVSHLEMRSMFLRQELSRIGDRIFNSFNEMFSTDKSAQNAIGRTLVANPDIFEAVLNKLELGDNDRDLANAYLSTGPVRTKIIQEGARILVNFFRSAYSANLLNPAHLAKKSQMKAISNGFEETERTEAHKEFRYLIIKKNEHLILPDTGLAFLKKKGMAPISKIENDEMEVIVPIGHQTYVYGYKKEGKHRDEITVNKILASCSFNSFIGKDESADCKNLISLVGKSAKLISDAEMRKLGVKALLESL